VSVHLGQTVNIVVSDPFQRYPLLALACQSDIKPRHVSACHGIDLFGEYAG